MLKEKGGGELSREGGEGGAGGGADENSRDPLKLELLGDLACCELTTLFK